MTPDQFKTQWTSIFPNTFPVQYLFKRDYSDRWFRIHSLPESQRYAVTEAEWEILLERQNTIITDVLGPGAKVLLVTGDFNFNEPEEVHITEQEQCFSHYAFKHLESIPLCKIDADEFNPSDVYRPAFAEITWQPNAHNALLKCIANDEVRAIFVLFEQSRLVAPYDGGIDIILEDSLARDNYKSKYRDWLSALESGL